MVSVNELLIYWVLPFVLIFVLVFAILHKTKLFGDDRQQINALIGVVLAAIFVSVPGPHTFYVVQMVPWLAVALIVLLIFFLLYGFIVGEMKEVPNWMRFGGLFLSIAVVFGIVVMITDIEGIINSYIGSNGDWMFSTLILILAVFAVYWAVKPQKKA